MQSGNPQPQLHPKYRADIDGLRAIAVLSVVIFHAFPEWLPGGFIGVDIFFVISGYLISTILFQNLDKGIFSLGDFYSRRIRRIFPSLLTVLISCYAAGWLILLADEYMQLGKHLLGGASFISNLVLWSESGYFDNIADTKPLLHLWSLGIEEQFYIIWPLLIWFAWKRRTNILVIILLIALASFATNIALVYTNPVAAFYSPVSRFWELLIGSALAYIVLYKQDITNRFQQLRTPLSIAGLGLFIVGTLLLSKTSLFPGWWALIPTIGGALLIFSGPNALVNQQLLSNRVLVWFGLISFPLYLWHWPLLSFAKIMQDRVSLQTRLVLVLISVVLAWLTYRLIETPIRRGGHNRTKVTILVLLMMVVAYAGWNVYQRGGLEFRYRKMIVIQPAQVRDLTKWEDKGMYPKGSCDPGFIYPEAHLCAQTKENIPADMVVFGDSHAFSAYWGISNSFGSAGHNVRLIGKGSGCLPLINQKNLACKDLINQQIQWINHQQNINTVFISFRNPLGNSASKNEISEFKDMVRATFQEFDKNHKRIIYLIAVPEARISPRLCVGDLPFGRAIDRDKCAFAEERERKNQAAYRTAIAEVLKEFSQVLVFDPATVLCPNGQCSINANETVMWMDDNHISESASYIQGKKIYSQIK
jgi:peptidoglycan/LPS O-acetylase OafA/YrhL